MELQRTDNLQQSHSSLPERKEDGFVFRRAGVAEEAALVGAGVSFFLMLLSLYFVSIGLQSQLRQHV